AVARTTTSAIATSSDPPSIAAAAAALVTEVEIETVKPRLAKKPSSCAYSAAPVDSPARQPTLIGAELCAETGRATPATPAPAIRLRIRRRFNIGAPLQLRFNPTGGRDEIGVPAIWADELHSERKTVGSLSRRQRQRGK